MVDGLQDELTDRAHVIRLNVAEPPGERAQEHYGFQKLPALILFDAAGNEVYRTEGKLPRKQQIREALGQ